jgi:hypothetical protein
MAHIHLKYNGNTKPPKATPTLEFSTDTAAFEKAKTIALLVGLSDWFGVIS